jgi:hypothetical protein
MYYRDENGKIIEGYDGTDSSGSVCARTPTWLMVLLAIIFALFIIFLIYTYIKNKKN